MSEKALATRKRATALRMQRDDNACLEIMRRVATRAARVVEGLFVEPGGKDFNPDALVPWAEASTKTRAALAIVKDERILAGAGAGVINNFGVIVLPGRMQSAEDWEKEAERVQAIDVEPVK